MSVGSRVRNFMVIHGSWQLVHHHRLGGVTNAAAWVGLGDTFGNPYMEAILCCGVPRVLYTIWYVTSKINTRG